MLLVPEPGIGERTVATGHHGIQSGHVQNTRDQRAQSARSPSGPPGSRLDRQHQTLLGERH